MRHWGWSDGRRKVEAGGCVGEIKEKMHDGDVGDRSVVDGWWLTELVMTRRR